MEIEAIWDNLLHGDESLESPEWHGKALSETEARVHAGQDESIEWGQAKADLRSR
ncbi:MAG: acyl-protein synthetase [Spirochaetaceae bacterium]|nr:MAG: acyl-protein synthetase [Spirochaetaceae bacterium]